MSFRQLQSQPNIEGEKKTFSLRIFGNFILFKHCLLHWIMDEYLYWMMRKRGEGCGGGGERRGRRNEDEGQWKKKKTRKCFFLQSKKNCIAIAHPFLFCALKDFLDSFQSINRLRRGKKLGKKDIFFYPGFWSTWFLSKYQGYMTGRTLWSVRLYAFKVQ